MFKFYLHQCQTHSHPSRFLHSPGPVALGSRGSIPLESLPLPTSRSRVEAGSEAQPPLLPAHHPCPIHALGSYPLFRGQPVSSEDVVIDTPAAEPQGEGTLDKDGPCWVVVGQSCLLTGTLDTWCGHTCTLLSWDALPTQQAWWKPEVTGTGHWPGLPMLGSLPTMCGWTGSSVPVKPSDRGICKKG